VPVDSTIADGARGLLEVDLAICTACLACKNACPIGVIDIVAGRDASGQRMITRFDIDAAKCMFCGLCSEPCPTGAIRHTKEFNLAVDDIRRLRLHFCDAPAAPYKLNKELPPAVEAPGRIIRSILVRQREGTIPVEPPPAPVQGGTPS
jgi:NADH-quinone oxidoreductase subunit I/NAD(P)H-quinone oxidoreductase subunit I